MKIPFPNKQIVVIHADHKETRQCYVDCLRIKDGELAKLTLDIKGRLGLQAADVNLAELDPREDF